MFCCTKRVVSHSIDIIVENLASIDNGINSLSCFSLFSVIYQYLINLTCHHCAEIIIGCNKNFFKRAYVYYY